jgi:SAP domain-containing ribonucleoprotein
VPNQQLDVDPAKTNDLTVQGGEGAPTAADGAIASAGATTTEPAPAPEAKPAVDFSIGIKQSDAEREAEKRAARAKRFGITESEEEKKKADRAKKFGIEKVEVVRGLDDALPERRQKRGRDGRDGQNGRDAKRQTTDRRNGPAPVKKDAPLKKAAPVTAVKDDPAEAAKAEARRKRFATAAS